MATMEKKIMAVIHLSLCDEWGFEFKIKANKKTPIPSAIIKIGLMISQGVLTDSRISTFSMTDHQAEIEIRIPAIASQADDPRFS